MFYLKGFLIENNNQVENFTQEKNYFDVKKQNKKLGFSNLLIEKKYTNIPNEYGFQNKFSILHKIVSFSHCWTIFNLDWLCENVNSHQKLETKIKCDSLNNKQQKTFITVELFPNGFDKLNSDYISLRIISEKYIFFRVWIDSDKNCELNLKGILKLKNQCVKFFVF